MKEIKPCGPLQSTVRGKGAEVARQRRYLNDTRYRKTVDRVGLSENLTNKRTLVVFERFLSFVN